MAYTTFTDFESVEKPVVLEGHKWRLEDTEWVSEEVEKEGIECDCCTHRIGTFDDEDFEPYATLAANPRQYMVEFYDNDPIQPSQVKRRIRNRLHNQIDGHGARVSKVRASTSGSTVTHMGYTIKASAGDGSYIGSDLDLHLITNGQLDHAINNALASALPGEIYPSDDIHTEGELHFCEGCAEEFGVPTTHGHSSVEEMDDEDEAEETTGIDANEAADRADFSELWDALISEGLPGVILFATPTLMTEFGFDMDAIEFATHLVMNMPEAMSMMGIGAAIPLTFAFLMAVVPMMIGGFKLLLFYGLAISAFISIFVRMIAPDTDHDASTRPPI